MKGACDARPSQLIPNPASEGAGFYVLKSYSLPCSKRYRRCRSLYGCALRDAELFPSSNNVAGGKINFGEYAQLWLDSREVVGGTKANYKGH